MRFGTISPVIDFPRAFRIGCPTPWALYTGSLTARFLLTVLPTTVLSLQNVNDYLCAPNPNSGFHNRLKPRSRISHSSRLEYMCIPASNAVKTLKQILPRYITCLCYRSCGNAVESFTSENNGVSKFRRQFRPSSGAGHLWCVRPLWPSCDQLTLWPSRHNEICHQNW